MAGRGRGRGKGTVSFDVGSLGFGKGDIVPAAILQPPPLYPPLEFKPSPLSNTEIDEYLLALKQEFRGGMRDSPFFIKADVKNKDIARYSDKYKNAQNNEAEFSPDNSLLPKELQVKAKKKRKVVVATPALKDKKRIKRETPSLDDTGTIEVLEKVLVERVVEDDEEVKEGDEVEIEEEYYEEEEEEENDYLVNHYDEGDDDFGMGDDDDADEGPVY